MLRYNNYIYIWELPSAAQRSDMFRLCSSVRIGKKSCSRVWYRLVLPFSRFCKWNWWFRSQDTYEVNFTFWLRLRYKYTTPLFNFVKMIPPIMLTRKEAKKVYMTTPRSPLTIFPFPIVLYSTVVVPLLDLFHSLETPPARPSFSCFRAVPSIPTHFFSLV